MKIASLMGCLLLSCGVASAEEGQEEASGTGLNKSSACSTAMGLAKARLPDGARAYNSDCTCDRGNYAETVECVARVWWRRKDDE